MSETVKDELTTIEKGDEITFNDRIQPLTVTSTHEYEYSSGRSDVTVRAEGPRGGSYRLTDGGISDGPTVERDTCQWSTRSEWGDAEDLESVEIVTSAAEVEPPVEVGDEFKRTCEIEDLAWTGETTGYRVVDVDRETQEIELAIVATPPSRDELAESITEHYQDFADRLDRGLETVDDLESEPDVVMRDDQDDEDDDDPEILEDGGVDEATDEDVREAVSEVEGDEWEPEPATLRNGETPDEAHTRRNAAALASLKDSEDPEIVTDGGEPLRSRLRPGDGIDLEIGGLLIVVGVAEASDGAPVYEVSAPKRSSTMLYRPHNFRAALEAGAEIVLDAAPVVPVEPFECPVCERLAFSRDARERTDGGIKVCSYGCERRSWTLSGREEIEDAVEDDEGPEIVTDGGFPDDDPRAEWCERCQRYRIECSHTHEVATDGGTTNMSGDSLIIMDGHNDRAEELASETSLTAGEANVAALKEDGLSHAEIAEELELSKSTVDEYSLRIKRRLREARGTVDELEDLLGGGV